MHITANDAEKVAENGWLKLVGRTVMLLIVPMFLFAWNWGVQNTNAISALSTRVSAIEDNQEDLEVVNAQSRGERVKFEDNILNRLDAILTQVAKTNERLARLEALREGK